VQNARAEETEVKVRAARPAANGDARGLPKKAELRESVFG